MQNCKRKVEGTRRKRKGEGKKNSNAIGEGPEYRPFWIFDPNLRLVRIPSLKASILYQLRARSQIQKGIYSGPSPTPYNLDLQNSETLWTLLRT
jgi:hypothetical protein